MPMSDRLLGYLSLVMLLASGYLAHLLREPMAIALIIGCSLPVAWFVISDPLRRPSLQVPARAIPYSAYLVVHLNTRQSPPMATFVGIYSSSASDLTNIGGEAHADLYEVTAASYHEASEEMARIAPIYFPWVVPLMTRNR